MWGTHANNWSRTSAPRQGNQLLAPMFDNGDAAEMMQFIIDSRPEERSPAGIRFARFRKGR